LDLAVNKATPLVSVVVPIYNTARYLQEAIESVCRQTHSNWELLLADDGSTDGSAKIAKEYVMRLAPKVSLLFHPDHGHHGPGATRNLAVQHAAGKYLAFLDADDVWLPQKLERQLPVLEQRPDVGMVYGMATCIDEHGKRLREPTGPYGWMADVGAGIPDQAFRAYEGFLRYRVYAPVSTVMVRKSLLLDLGGFAPGCRFQCEDQIMWTRIAKHVPVYYLPRALALYRVHSDSWSGRQNPLSVVDAEVEYLLRLASDARGMDTLVADALARFALAYWKCGGIPLRLRLRRSNEVVRCLQAHGALGHTLTRYTGRLWRTAVLRVMRFGSGSIFRESG
jgi:glycosyltransferase involved in cell wall biosynthesis